jgi:hypothetical protein
MGEADAFRNEWVNKIKYFKKVVWDVPQVPPAVLLQITAIETKLKDYQQKDKW